MRQATGPASEQLISYQPEALGNRSRANPIELEILVPTYGQRRRLYALAELAEPDPDGRRNFELRRSIALQEEAIRTHLRKVRHYKDDQGRPIETPEQFLEHAEDPFFAEAWTVILVPRLLTEVEKKTSPSSDASVDGAPIALPGHVRTAEPKVSSSNAGAA